MCMQNSAGCCLHTLWPSWHSFFLGRKQASFIGRICFWSCGTNAQLRGELDGSVHRCHELAHCAAQSIICLCLFFQIVMRFRCSTTICMWSGCLTPLCHYGKLSFRCDLPYGEGAEDLSAKVTSNLKWWLCNDLWSCCLKSDVWHDH